MAVGVYRPRTNYPQRRKLYVQLYPSGGVGAYTLTADSGTFAVTGQDANLFANRLLTADNATYSLSGQDVTLDYSGQADVPYLELDFTSGNAATGTLEALIATGTMVAYQATGTLVVTDTGF